LPPDISSSENLDIRSRIGGEIALAFQRELALDR